MKIEKIKDLAYYESLPYTIVVRKDEDGEFVARIQELNGCIAHGETEASAIQNLRSMQRLWIEDALSAEDDIPEPEEEASLPKMNAINAGIQADALLKEREKRLKRNPVDDSVKFIVEKV